MGNEQSKDEDDLPPGWESHLDEASGKYFYVDHVNGSTTWEKPSSVRSVRPPPPPPPSDLPPGWESRVDESSKKTYYVDHMNRTSTWEIPTQAARLKDGLYETDIGVPQFGSAIGSTSLSMNGSPSPSGRMLQQDPYMSKIPTSLLEQSDVLGLRDSRLLEHPAASRSGQLVDDGSTIQTVPEASTIHRALPSQEPHVSSATVAWSGTTMHDAQTPAAPSMRTMDERKCYPEATVHNPVSRDLDNWVLLEAPKQRELAPKGFHAFRKAMEKRNLDRSLALENIEARNVSINGYYLTMKQVRWFAVQFGARLRSDTHYWYDSSSGFLGKLGGPVKFIVDPSIKCPGKLNSRSSLGETTTLVNGREITEAEVKLWAGVDMQLRPNTQYIVEPDGTTSRVGDDQPLYNWHDKVRAAEKKRLAVAKSVRLFGADILGMVGKDVVKGISAHIVNGLLGES